jgi:ATP-binding cassette subfamily B protein RaxB
MQDDQLFGGSIAENIAFAMEVDEDKVRRCARMAAIEAEIEQMPMQYETLVGDMGTVLSGGQKQRILLARALYREPQLLIVDEGTSHLDARTEGVVNRSVRSLGVTRIIIAHRLETILSADRILLFDHGRLVQEVTNGGEETRRLIEERGLQWVQG